MKWPHGRFDAQRRPPSVASEGSHTTTSGKAPWSRAAGERRLQTASSPQQGPSVHLDQRSNGKSLVADLRQRETVAKKGKVTGAIVNK